MRKKGSVLLDLSIFLVIFLVFILVFYPVFDRTVSKAKAVEIPSMVASISSAQSIYLRESEFYATAQTIDQVNALFDFTLSSEGYFSYATKPQGQGFVIDITVTKSFGGIAKGNTVHYLLDGQPYVYTTNAQLWDYLEAYIKTVNGGRGDGRAPRTN